VGTMNVVEQAVVNSLSEQIFATLSRVGSENVNPVFGADQSDEVIKINTHKAKELRRIREEYENLMTGAIYS
jgi:hypothetical protein